MNVEVEAKLKVDDLDPVRVRLGAAGAVFVSTVLQTDSHYDTADGRLRSADSVLRIRRVQTTRGAAASATLAYKGPRLPGKVKRRPEIELETGDPDVAARLLEALGFLPVSTLEKLRETWNFLGCAVALDELPYLGTFVEIEGPGEEAIARAQQALGLDHLAHVKPGYLALLVEHCRRHNLPITHIRLVQR